jgi:hypothetical protein
MYNAKPSVIYGFHGTDRDIALKFTTNRDTTTTQSIRLVSSLIDLFSVIEDHPFSLSSHQFSA